jgi:DNA helicase-2/ATP-dependent DNA helicase PcrA
MSTNTITKFYPQHPVPNLTLVSPQQHFNAEQLDAITAIDGISMIVSGAGTGKTSCIIGKIKQIKKHHPEARMLLVISFTRKAVDEIRHRLDNEQHVHVVTFHSLFYRILTANGFKSFSLIEESQKTAIANMAIRKLHLEKKLEASAVLESLNKPVRNSSLRKVRTEYLQIQRSHHLMDFDSMQIFCYELLKGNPALLNQFQHQFDYILVDEFQDVNVIQWEILKLLAPNRKGTNLTVVGDPRQAIYGFRGSYPEILDEFAKHYGNKVNRFSLTKNYRSTPAILNLGNQLMPQYSLLTAVRGQDDFMKPLFHAAKDEDDEAKFIINRVKALHKAGSAYQDMVILYRSVTVTTHILMAMQKARIPVVRLNGGFLYDSQEYKLIFSSCKIGLHKETTYDVKRVLPLLGIDSSKHTEIKKYAVTNHIPYFTAVLRMIAVDKRDDAAKLVEAIKNILTDNMSTFIRALWRYGLSSYISDEENQRRDEILSQLPPGITPADWLDAIDAQRKEYAAMMELASKKDADYVSIMSIHAAKGMEFSTVFVVGAMDGVLPDTHHLDVSIDEEQRLAYVAVTRAKESLYISYPRKSYMQENKPSRFFEKAF